jgi:hypothetical protein
MDTNEQTNKQTTASETAKICFVSNSLNLGAVTGHHHVDADKSFARPGRQQATSMSKS